MFTRDVQRFEIVPFVFDFRTIGNREPQPAHNVLEFFHRLRDRVQTADAKLGAGHGGVELRLAFLGCHGRRGQSLGGGLESRIDLLFGLVETLTGSRAVGLVDLAHAFLRRFEPALFRAQELDAGRLDGLRIRRGTESLHRLRGQFVQLSEEIRQCHKHPRRGVR